MKRGFTLVELLAVIVVLSAILLIVIPTVSNVIKSSKKSLSEIQIKSIEKAAKQYYLDKGINESENCIDINSLIETGYLDIDKINNPKDGEELTGSVKIEYKDNKYKYVYSENRCAICDVIVGDGTSIGDKLVCEVKPGTKYNFYVLSKEDDKSTNLIMDRNICDDGTLDTKEKGCTVAWISEEYLEEHLSQEDLENYRNYNIFGPITAMEYLNNATSTWENINNFNTTYDDEGGHFNEFIINGKARLPYLREVSNYNGTNGYLYENINPHCEDEYGKEMSCDDDYYILLASDGYWLFDSDSGLFAYHVSYGGYVDPGGFALYDDWIYGVRPVINISNEDINIGIQPIHICESTDESTVTFGNIPEGYYEPGDEYICEVKAGTKYHFFVIGTDGNNVNLIMDQNINSDGTPAGITAITQAPGNVYNLMPWYSGGNNNTYGPLTVLNFLYNATKDWVYIPPVNYSYYDRESWGVTADNQGYISFVAEDGVATITSYSNQKNKVGTKDNPLRTRLPIYLVGKEGSEVLYKNKASYLFTNLREGNTGVYGYWTLSTASKTQAWALNYGGTIFNAETSASSFYGVRPVISVSKNSIK